MKTSESIAKMAPDLVAALTEIGGVSKGTENGHFKTKYADLSAVIDTSKPILAKHNIGLMQFPGELGERSMSLETVLMHTSGEWISGVSEIFVNKPTPQETGSAISYLRRYAQKAVLNMADQDDDGESAMQRNKATEKPITPEPEGEAFWGWGAPGVSMNANQAKKAGLGEVMSEMCGRIEELADGVEIDEWIEAVKPEVARMPRGWGVELRNRVNERARTLGLTE